MSETQDTPQSDEELAAAWGAETDKEDRRGEKDKLALAAGWFWF